MPGDEKSEYKRSLSYSLPGAIGLFFRELLAVTFLLLMEQRVGNYDFFNNAFILLLVLITFRTPYINSYAFFFELTSLNKWDITNHVGLQKHRDFTQNLLIFIVVLAGHVGAAIGAAALRVLIDVTYGVESLASGQSIEPMLSVSIGSLQSIDTFWGTEKRLNRLATVGLFNSTRTVSLPLQDISILGIDSAAVALWYLLEEVGYVTLLCMCLVHIWLGAGRGKDDSKPMEPFKPEFWKRLFRVSFLLAAVSTALSRCFPTAHGSLHHTIFKCQYQAWNPDIHIVDNENQEPMIRILGGLLGVVVAFAYNKILISTRDNKDDEGYYYRMVWGRDPVPDDTPVKSDAALYPERRYTRGPPVRKSAAAGPDAESSYYGRGGCDVRTICISRCKVHPGGTGCNADCLKAQQQAANAELDGSNGFKLRIPYTLDHPK
jgi:hypothetical protein